jgi:prevent-host-death family protein
MVDLSLSEAGGQLDALVDRAVSAHERVTITQDRRPAAVLVSAEELADLDDALALARYDARAASGQTTRVSQDDARRRLGLPRA